MPRVDIPKSMFDPKLAMELYRQGRWTTKCMIPGCKTETQGGPDGYEAHLRTVHPGVVERMQDRYRKAGIS